MKNRSVILKTIVLLLGCFGLLCEARATDLDGVLPGGNNADGYRVLTNLTTGGFNTGSGWFSLFSDQAGSLNTAFGAATLFSNTGGQNTAVGAAALFYNTGDGNTADGAFALFSNTVGAGNTATGLQALYSNVDGIRNTADGVYALNHNVSGDGNTAIGYQALVTNTANSNTAIGNDSLVSNTSGTENTATGAGSLLSNVIGFNNTAMGNAALAANVAGNFNTAIGRKALLNSTGTNNTALGEEAGLNVSTASSVICIGGGVLGADVSNTCFIGNIFGVTTGGVGSQVLVDASGQLGTMSSSRRFKKDVQAMDKASEALLSLKPVTFHYKSDKTNTSQFGLIAEEVAEVNPDLVVRDKDGVVYSVRYDAVNVMLLNEFLKEHKKVAEQQATIAQLKRDFQIASAEQRREIASVTAQVKKQTAQIQKVSAQFETSKPAPQVVTNDQ